MSAPSLVGTFTNVFVVGFIFGVCGVIIDTVNSQTVGFALSYSTLNTMNYITMAFWVIPIIFFIVSMINYVLQSASEAGGYA